MHILIGSGLILRVSDIVSANLNAKDDKDNDCIKVKVQDGTTWTVWQDLEQSRQKLRSITTQQTDRELLLKIRAIVFQKKRTNSLQHQLRKFFNNITL